MKLRKIKGWEYKGKRYYKFSVLIPTEAVRQLGWKPGDELRADVGEKNLVIEKREIALPCRSLDPPPHSSGGIRKQE